MAKRNAAAVAAASTVASSSTTSAIVAPIAKSISSVPASSSSPSLIRSFFLPGFVFVIVLGIYLSSIYPSITGGDSGELLITVCNLGIAHPPGYPLYTMLGWLWANFVMTWGHMALRVNVLCAIMGALAATIISHTTMKIAKRIMNVQSSSGFLSPLPYLCGLYAGVGFGCSHTVWLYSIQGEVFPLNNLLCAIMIALTGKYYCEEEKIDERKAIVGEAKKDGADKKTKAAASLPLLSTDVLITLSYLGAFVCGLALTNQHTTVFPVLIISSAISWSLLRRGLLPIRRVILLVIAVLVGLSPYAYLSLRSRYRVMDSWGDQRTIDGFLKHLLRREYGTFQLAASDVSADPGMASRLKMYGENMRTEMTFLTPALAMVGMVATLCSSLSSVRRPALILLASFAAYVLVFHKLANLDLRPLFLGVQARFWQQSNMVVWVWSAVGLAVVSNGMTKLCGSAPSPATPTTKKEQTAAPTLSISTMLCSLYCVAFLAHHVHHQYPVHHDRSTDLFYRHGSAVLQSFPPRSIVLLNGDLNNNLIKYPQQCEGERRDVHLLSIQLMSWSWFVPMQALNYPGVVFPGNRYHVARVGSFNMRQFLDANIDNPNADGGIYLCGLHKEGDYSVLRPDKTEWYEQLPYGVCNRLVPHGTKVEGLAHLLRRGWSGLLTPSLMPPFSSKTYGLDTWDHSIYSDSMVRLSYMASYASYHASINMTDTDMLQLAYELTRELNNESSRVVSRALNNIAPAEYRAFGVIYGRWALYIMSTKNDNAEALKNEANSLMLEAWTRYREIVPTDEELLPYVRDRANPYSGELIGRDQL